MLQFGHYSKNMIKFNVGGNFWDYLLLTAVSNLSMYSFTSNWGQECQEVEGVTHPLRCPTSVHSPSYTQTVIGCAKCAMSNCQSQQVSTPAHAERELSCLSFSIWVTSLNIFFSSSIHLLVKSWVTFLTQFQEACLGLKLQSLWLKVFGFLH